MGHYENFELVYVIGFERKKGLLLDTTHDMRLAAGGMV